MFIVHGNVLTAFEDLIKIKELQSSYKVMELCSANSSIPCMQPHQEEMISRQVIIPLLPEEYYNLNLWKINCASP